jgi:AraC-like DNA-binding protein
MMDRDRAIANGPAVTTILMPGERARVDAAGMGVYRTVHRESLSDVLRDLRERRADAVVLSVSCCGTREAPLIATMVREFPRVPTVALLTEPAVRSPQTLITLGRSGVATLIDARDPAGWRELRQVLASDHLTRIRRVALARLRADLGVAPDDCWMFFEALFETPAQVTTVRSLSRRLGILPSTLMSRFFRAHLPAPKRYLAMARLVLAAELFGNPGLSVSGVANQLDYSSPQSFGRHVKSLLRMTAAEFRMRLSGERMLDLFRERLVLPYAATLAVFHPLVSTHEAMLGRRGGKATT